MNFKKFTASASALLLALKTKAYIWIIVGLAVLVVGGVAVVKLIEVTKLIDKPNTPPPPQVPENVLRVYLENQQTGLYDQWLFDSLAIGLQVGMGHDVAQNTNTAPADVAAAGFVMQYGMISNLWLKAGDGIDSMKGVQVGETVGDEEDYSWTLAAAGYLIHFTHSSTETNAYGYSWQIDDDDTNAYPIRIERTTNFVNWEVVMTNAGVRRYSVQTWKDTNAPSEKAFYRIRQN